MTSPESAGSAETAPLSVHEDTGYSHPYDPSQLTPDQANQLHSQGLGGVDAARVAARPERLAVSSPEEQYQAALRWSERNRTGIEQLKQGIDEALATGDTRKAAQLTAKCERLRRTQRDISSRIGYLIERIENNE